MLITEQHKGFYEPPKDAFGSKPRSMSQTSDALTVKDLEFVRADMAKKGFQLTKAEKTFAWTVLMILLLAQVSN